MITGQIDIRVDDAMPVVRSVNRYKPSPQVRIDLVSVAHRPEASVAFHGTFSELHEWAGEFVRVLVDAEREFYGQPSEYAHDRDAYGEAAGL